MTVVHLRHPAFLPYRLRTGKVVRRERTSLVTPVLIPDLDADEVDVVQTDSDGYMYAVAEGALWNVVMDGRTRAPMAREDFVGWMEGAPQVHHNAVLSRLMARSPLVRLAGHMVHDRGRDPLPPGSRPDEEMVGIMSAAARDFVESDLRTCQGCLLVRSRGPHVCVEKGQLVVSHVPAALPPWRIHARPDHSDDLWRVMAGRRRVSGPTPRIPSWILSLPSSGDGDLVLAANEAVSWAVHALHARRGHAETDIAGGATLLAMREDLYLADEVASYGLVSLAEAENVLARCSSAMTALIGDRGLEGVEVPGCYADMASVTRDKLAFLEDVLMPRVRTATMADDGDLDAMVGLGF